MKKKRGFNSYDFMYLVVILVAILFFIAEIYAVVKYRNVPVSEVPFWAWALFPR